MPGPSPAAVSARDLEVLEAFEELTAETGVSPTVRELAARLGLGAGQTVQHHVNRLVAAGRLQRATTRKLRALSVVRPSPRPAVRLVSVVEDPWHDAPAGARRVPLPDLDLAVPTEPLVAMVSPMSLPNGPLLGDLIYCASRRVPRTDDVVVTIDTRDNPRLVRWPAGLSPSANVAGVERHAVVVGWSHRQARRE